MPELVNTTRQQRWAQEAFKRVEAMKDKPKEEEYKRFAKSFPALLHHSGLCQALAFAEAKGNTKYLEDLAGVLNLSSVQLERDSRTNVIVEYQRLSREVMNVSTWIKRYAEALLKGGD